MKLPLCSAIRTEHWFERLFALDTERLREGGRELLASNDSIADALLSAAGGLRRARQVHQSLLNARDLLAPLRKAQARPFYQSLDSMLEARQRLSATLLKPEMREKQDIELAHLRAEQEKCNKLAGAASQRIARLERIRRVVGVLAEHDAAVAWLDAHPDAPELPANAGERLAKAQDEMLRAESFFGARAPQPRTDRGTARPCEVRQRVDRPGRGNRIAHRPGGRGATGGARYSEARGRACANNGPRRRYPTAVLVSRCQWNQRPRLDAPRVPQGTACTAAGHGKPEAATALTQLPAELEPAGQHVAATEAAQPALPAVVARVASCGCCGRSVAPASRIGAPRRCVRQ